MKETAQLFWQRVFSQKISQQELARKTGIKRGTISTQVSGQRLPKLEDALKIAQALNLRIEDLLGVRYASKQGSMTSMADISDRLFALREYTERSMQSLLKSPLTHLIQEMHALVKTLEKMTHEYTVALPLLEESNNTEEESYSIQELGSVAAGPMRETWEVAEKNHKVPARFIPSGHQQSYFVLRVTGTSMLDYGIEDGAFCLIKKARAAEYGQVIVVRDGDSVTLKQFVRSEDGKSMLAYHDGSNRKIVCTPQMEVMGVFVQVLRGT